MNPDPPAPPPPIRGAEAALREAERERAFWTANEQRLTVAYPDQFVAVAPADGRVVGTADTLPELYAELRHDGVDPHRVWVRFLSSDPRRFIL
jgi:hypothetical protein